MAFSAVQSKASERLLGANEVFDVGGMSPNAKARVINLVIPTVVANSTTATGLAIPAAMIAGMKVVGAQVTYFGTVPAQSGGTTTIQIDRIATDGTTATVIVALVTILTGLTANVAAALTLAATNPTAITAGQTIKASVIASNNTVQTSGADYGSLTLHLEPIEETVITVSQT